MFDRREHWEKIYREKHPDQMSWYQTEPKKSLDLITHARTLLSGNIIDVGGGSSVLVDRLLKTGFKNITVLDISETALESSKKRLGIKAKKVKWVVEDITKFNPTRKFDLWHDRAVFHFLTGEVDRRKYVEALNKALKPGGHLVLASFARRGPSECSNLKVCQYDSASIQRELGIEFKLVKEEQENHITPWMKEQKFVYFLFTKTK